VQVRGILEGDVKLNRRFHIALVVMFFFLSALLFSTLACASQAAGAVGTLVADVSPVYEVPAEKKQKWESMQNIIQKEYDICIEHCGNNKSCEDKCMQVYKTRLDRAHKQLISE
jgi:hypothetical protein